MCFFIVKLKIEYFYTDKSPFSELLFVHWISAKFIIFEPIFYFGRNYKRDRDNVTETKAFYFLQRFILLNNLSYYKIFPVKMKLENDLKSYENFCMRLFIYKGYLKRFRP